MSIACAPQPSVVAITILFEAVKNFHLNSLLLQNSSTVYVVDRSDLLCASNSVVSILPKAHAANDIILLVVKKCQSKYYGRLYTRFNRICKWNPVFFQFAPKQQLNVNISEKPY